MRMISLLTALAARLAAHRQAARVRRVATRELAAMSACELSDMGITRLDVSRLFEPRPMSGFQAPEFRSRRTPQRGSAASMRPRAIQADSFARTVAFAISQPEDLDINEILFRPTRQEI
jgi:NADP-dependent 3-hydroxy acid dehydrogenase YdfG